MKRKIIIEIEGSDERDIQNAMDQVAISLGWGETTGAAGDETGFYSFRTEDQP